MVRQVKLEVFFYSIFVATLFAMVDSAMPSCSKNATSVPVIPSQVGGVWYEIARIPSSEVPACLKVIVPDYQLNGNYSLKLEYRNNVNNGWKYTEETLVFPWSQAQNGTFDLFYGNGITNITVNFKYMGTLGDYSVVCGYSDVVPNLSIIRILSRNKLVDHTVQEEIDTLANNFDINLSELTWVEQGEKCNGTSYMSLIRVEILFMFYLIQIILKNIL
ncbi:uncharacterized protein ACRADG_011099 [Cochliomyia hominivorax]